MISQQYFGGTQNVEFCKNIRQAQNLDFAKFVEQACSHKNRFSITITLQDYAFLFALEFCVNKNARVCVAVMTTFIIIIIMVHDRLWVKIVLLQFGWTWHFL